MEDYIGKICPYCRTTIREGEEVKICPSCGIPHHAFCWEENKGCTTFGCSGQSQGQTQAASSDVCANCGAPLDGEHAFCPKCGTPKPIMEQNLCGNCGQPLDESQEFCPKCGTPKGIKKNVCSACGTELQEEQMFCPKCGQRADGQDSGVAFPAVNPAASGAGKPTEKKKMPIPAILGAVAGAIGLIVLLIVLLLPKDKKPSSISVSRSSISIDKGETYSLDYTVEPAKASDYEVSWSSDNAVVASVKNGVVTGNSVGSCVITVKTDNGKTSECKVTVTMPAVERKVIGTWRATEILDLDEMDTTYCSSWGWKLIVYDDYTASFDATATTTTTIDFDWGYSRMNDYGNDVYTGSDSSVYFIYNNERDEIWLYLQSGTTNLCITCKK